MSTLTLYLGNDMALEVDALRDQATSSYINGATVAVTLKDMDGTNVTGETWPLSLPYVSSSNGKYRATLAYNLGVSVNERYVATITVDAGAGKRARWDADVVVAPRRD